MTDPGDRPDDRRQYDVRILSHSCAWIWIDLLTCLPVNAACSAPYRWNGDPATSCADGSVRDSHHFVFIVHSIFGLLLFPGAKCAGELVHSLGRQLQAPERGPVAPRHGLLRK
jgi:hypothetical protein